MLRYVNTELWGPPNRFLYDLFSSRGRWVGVVTSPCALNEIWAGYAYAFGTASEEEYPVVEGFTLVPDRD